MPFTSKVPLPLAEHGIYSSTSLTHSAATPKPNATPSTDLIQTLMAKYLNTPHHFPLPPYTGSANNELDKAFQLHEVEAAGSVRVQ